MSIGKGYILPMINLKGGSDRHFFEAKDFGPYLDDATAAVAIIKNLRLSAIDLVIRYWN